MGEWDSNRFGYRGFGSSGRAAIRFASAYVARSLKRYLGKLTSSVSFVIDSYRSCLACGKIYPLGPAGKMHRMVGAKYRMRLGTANPSAEKIVQRVVHLTVASVRRPMSAGIFCLN